MQLFIFFLFFHYKQATWQLHKPHKNNTAQATWQLHKPHKNNTAHQKTYEKNNKSTWVPHVFTVIGK
jgi:hypothetical protein